MRGKRLALLSAFLVLISALLHSGPASGQTPDPGGDNFFWVLEGPVLPVLRAAPGDTPAVTADAAVVLDADTGQVLYAKNAHQPRPIASTTKIMTALLAIECSDLKSTVTVSPRAAGVEGSSIYLRAGEKLSLEELLYGALMHSGNDACVAIAEHVAGREELFVAWMNLKAAQLGLKNTRFANTNGLPHREHLCSAYDLAVIAGHALKNPVFSSMVSTRSHTISGPGGRRHLSNTNQMLWGYTGANGVKTGTTSAAGKCLVASARRNGRGLIAVVLHSDNRYGDSARLLDYGFASFKNETVVKGGEALTFIPVAGGVMEAVPVGSPGDVVVTVPVGGEASLEKVVSVDGGMEAPVKAGSAAGRLTVFAGGDPVARTGLVTLEGTERKPAHLLVIDGVRKRLR